jgi:hypothetical protein
MGDEHNLIDWELKQWDRQATSGGVESEYHWSETQLQSADTRREQARRTGRSNRRATMTKSVLAMNVSPRSIVSLNRTIASVPHWPTRALNASGCRSNALH